MKVIKGKKEYPLKKGDYILFNGAIWMFKPQDNSILPFGMWKRPQYITISKKEANRILISYTYAQREEPGGMIYYKIFNKPKK